MDIFKQIRADIKEAVIDLVPKDFQWDSYVLEFPKDPLNGDIYTNIALILGSYNNQTPRERALNFQQSLSKIDYIAHIEIAGGGFINFTIKASKWQEFLYHILDNQKEFWFPNIGKQAKVNIEFVSANPTGPLHIGHTRCAIYGDILSNLFKLTGYEVTKEYYINDAGSQIEILIDTVILRCKEILSGIPIKINEIMYPGEYLKEIAAALVVKYRDKLLLCDQTNIRLQVKNFTINHIMNLIKKDLALLNICHDVFVSEQKLQDQGMIEKSIEVVEKTGLLYHGKIDLPKSKSAQKMEHREQLLFKSSKFGDAQDRPIKKQDGSWTYFASDFAYAKNKIDRGFEILVYILGADHKGYIDRINAIVQVLGQGKVKSIVQTNALVNFVENDVPIKMSKRNGNILGIAEVLKDVGKDILRFMMIIRKNDLEMDFDFAKIVKQTKDNPIFYIQYAYVRISSILNKAKTSCPEAIKILEEKNFDLSLLSNEEEIEIIKLLAIWPHIISSSLKFFEPHRIANYLLEIASKFHSMWNLGKNQKNYLFLLENNPQITAARLAFITAIQKTILKCFEIIGIEPLKEM